MTTVVSIILGFIFCTSGYGDSWLARLLITITGG